MHCILKKTQEIFAFVLSLFIFSCASNVEPAVFELPDYTEENVRAEEIKRINEFLEKDEVLALWRATLLGDEGTIQKCYQKVLSSLKETEESSDYQNAFRLLNSLAFCGHGDLSENGYSPQKIKEIEQKRLNLVPGLSRSKSEKNHVSTYISGTVTVWVDKGIKIERGLGYADRVIGSGFFISKDGYLITNHHVIADLVDPKNKDYSRLFVKLAEDSDTRIPAKVIGYDKILDLALLKAETDAPFVFNLGSSEGLEVGTRIFAIGSPAGLERTLTSGIVSATDRKLFTLGSVLQFDAAVNPGNSGGPCIDESGNVQAVVFAGSVQYEGLNFAIPVEYVKSLLPALYAGGKISHPWISAFGRTWRDLGKNAGLLLQYVLPGGSAFRSGLRAGDAIIEAGGKQIKTLEDFQNVLIATPARSIIKIRYIQNALDGGLEEKEAAVYLSPRPESPGRTVYESDIIANAFVPIFGMKLVPTSEGRRKKFSIVQILSGSIADESGFSENEPLEVRTVKMNEDKTAIYAEVYAKNRKRGYIDSVQMIAAPLDSPYYF